MSMRDTSTLLHWIEPQAYTLRWPIWGSVSDVALISSEMINCPAGVGRDQNLVSFGPHLHAEILAYNPQSKSYLLKKK